MMEPEDSLEAHITQAIAALTAAARSTYRSADAATQRYDFGEIACRVITAVAANLGSVETLLAGRPGSWEADHVRQIVQSTVSDDELHTYRTEPVYLDLDPDIELNDVGLDALYWEDTDSINHELGAHGLHKADAERLEQEQEAIDALRDADAQKYATAYTSAVRAAAQEFGLTVPVLVTVTDEADGDVLDPLTERLRDFAHQRTPLPSSGIAPKDYPAGQNITAIERAAGRTYRGRLIGD